MIAASLSSADDLQSLWAELPAGARRKNGETFAQLLIQRGKLTQFQSQEVLRGTKTSLVLGDYVLQLFWCDLPLAEKQVGHSCLTRADADRRSGIPDLKNSVA